MTDDQYRKHLEAVAAGPRSAKEIAAAERKYRARILQGQAELAAAEHEARRAPGAPPLSRFAGLRASMPGFTSDIAALPEVSEVERETVTTVKPAKNGNGGSGEPDREILRAIGALFITVKKERGRAFAWEEVEDALMVNLHRLAGQWGTIKDIISLALHLAEYSNPVVTGSARKQDKTSLYRKALLMDEGEE